MNLFHLFYESSGACIDTRSIKKDGLFIALKGNNFDGNDYVEIALKEGAKYCISDRESVCNNTTVFYTEDSLLFLQNLALYHRRKFTIPLIGITGSNGKTSTKELINAVLKEKYEVLCTAGNFNNHIGVPLTLLNLNAQHEIAIIEMGANKPGDIAELCAIAEPSHGVITNIGKAHLEGFKDLAGIIKTKKELYTSVSYTNKGVLFYNADDELLTKHLPNNTQNISYGISESSVIYGELIGLNPAVNLRYGHDEFKSDEVQTQLIGKYNFYNFLCAISIGVFFKVKDENIINAITHYISTNNRSQVAKTSHNTLIIDCYNANPSSMASALESFIMIAHDNKLAIIGDMLELGSESDIEHEKIIHYCEANSINYLSVGENFAAINSKPATNFLSTEELIAYLKVHPLKDMLVLLKGSRGIALEKLVPVL